MAEETKPPAKDGSILKKKWHGVPVPVLLVGGGVGAYLLYRWYKNRSSSSSSTTTPSTTSTGDTTGTGDTGSYGGGGGWGGYGNPQSTTPSTTTTTTTPSTTPAAESPTNVLAGTAPALSLGQIGTLTPGEVLPGGYQLPYTTAGPGGAAQFIEAAQGLAGGAQNIPAGLPGGGSGPVITPTTPTGQAAQSAPVNQALATSEANLAKAQAAEKANPSAANAAAVKAHESQVKAGR